MGPDASPVQLTVRDSAGAERIAVVERQQERFTERPAYQAPSLTDVEILPSGFGYLDLTRLSFEDVDAALAKIWETSALVIDLRGYPKGVFPILAPRFATTRRVAARFRRPEVREPRASYEDRCSEVWFSQWVEPSGDAYTGRVCVLINCDTMSQAEHTCLWLEAACGPTFVGSPTRGANGDVTMVELIPGLSCAFSGHDVTHSDGRQLQRVGIQPHVHVRPTLAGVRCVRDEVLDAAVAHLGGSA
jgi:C-terminal processing protease CtpA/Prc